MFRDVPECSGMFHVPGFIDAPNSFLCLLLSLSRFLDRHFGFLWRFPLTTRSQTSVPRSPLPAPRSPFLILVTSPCMLLLYIKWIWTNYCKLSRNFVAAIGTTTINCRVSFIDLYLVFPRNFRMLFLPHTNTVILLERYCGTMTEPGLPVEQSVELSRLIIFYFISNFLIYEPILPNREPKTSAFRSVFVFRAVFQLLYQRCQPLET